jgi:hypothetical protein
MPNHVTTQCVITGPDKELERLRTTVIRVPERGDQETLDFNLIIPMPETLKSTTAGSDADLGIEVLTGKPKPCIFAGNLGSRISMNCGLGQRRYDQTISKPVRRP